MKLTWHSPLADLLFHLLIAVIGGALAFRACLYGIGWGSGPDFAIPAGIVTGLMTFIFSLALFDMAETEKGQRRVQLLILGFLLAVHVVAFAFR